MGFGDACSPGPAGLRCPDGPVSSTGCWTVLALPPAGLLAALALGAIGGGRALHRGGTGLRWTGLAWAVFVAAFALEIAVGNFVLWQLAPDGPPSGDHAATTPGAQHRAERSSPSGRMSRDRYQGRADRPARSRAAPRRCARPPLLRRPPPTHERNLQRPRRVRRAHRSSAVDREQRPHHRPRRAPAVRAPPTDTRSRSPHQDRWRTGRARGLPVRRGRRGRSLHPRRGDHAEAHRRGSRRDLGNTR